MSELFPRPEWRNSSIDSPITLYQCVKENLLCSGRDRRASLIPSEYSNQRLQSIGSGPSNKGILSTYGQLRSGEKVKCRNDGIYLVFTDLNVTAPRMATSKWMQVCFYLGCTIDHAWVCLLSVSSAN